MKKIIKIVTFYDDGTFTESVPQTSINPMPSAPFSPVPHTVWPINNCSKCGLKLEGAMGYVCNQHPCPTGMGGAWCSTADAK